MRSGSCLLRGPSQGMGRCEAMTIFGHDKLRCMGWAGDIEQNNLIPREVPHDAERKSERIEERGGKGLRNEGQAAAVSRNYRCDRY